MTKKKVKGNVVVFLPCGGSLKFPHNISKETMREKCAAVDPSCATAQLAQNEDGSYLFVRNMGTKG